MPNAPYGLYSRHGIRQIAYRDEYCACVGVRTGQTVSLSYRTVRPCSIAHAAIWVRVEKLSLFRMWATWVLAVLSAITSSVAICRLVSPRASKAATSRSRELSGDTGE